MYDFDFGNRENVVTALDDINEGSGDFEDHEEQEITTENILSELITDRPITTLVHTNTGEIFDDILEEIKGSTERPEEKLFQHDGPFGGYKTSWSDESQYLQNGPITGIQLRGGDVLDAIRVKYGTIWGPWHGGNGGRPGWSFELNPEESIVKVQGTGSANHFWYGSIIATIEFITNQGQTFGPYGIGDRSYENHNSNWQSIANQPFCKLAWISGDSGSFLKSLSFNYDCQTESIEPIIELIY